MSEFVFELGYTFGYMPGTTSFAWERVGARTLAFLGRYLEPHR